MFQHLWTRTLMIVAIVAAALSLPTVGEQAHAQVVKKNEIIKKLRAIKKKAKRAQRTT